jgi:hypothetical protein
LRWGEEMTFFCEENKKVTVNKESKHFVFEDKRKFKLSVTESDVLVTWPTESNIITAIAIHRVPPRSKSLQAPQIR